jgi:hypothetical protein
MIDAAVAGIEQTLKANLKIGYSTTRSRLRNFDPVSVRGPLLL